MIVFDLTCPQAHVFEAWFGSSEDYRSQRARGLVSCPLCGSHDVEKAVMAPAVGAKGNQALAPRPAAAPPSAPVALRNGPPAPAEMKAMLRALADAQARALRGSTDVGSRFAAEARAMHDGDRDEAPIHGRATLAEARALIEDGVPVAPLPFPVIPPDDLH